ncbi:hypothetical protein GRS48_11355 [Halorubrum sp. JWXQ-INN 858]|uniref:DUF7512 family protein n=1 Tax=Halorubrum sp. JWXQ-INN 858 TaxID=2690782 RepID=UPI00135B7D76|nr:hypothetical protein [Halorubrum sp. JWXQ-INN 858]MWV65408.1 hypothetical protein [Halorubrum sp. JWXQ-INN 858]
MNRNVSDSNYYLRRPEGESMAGLAVPTWDPQTALLIGVILLEAVVLYVGYGGLERLVGPRVMDVLVGGDQRAGQ